MASPSAQTTQAKSPLLGHLAPSVAGSTVDGTFYRLPRSPGHYVLLNFFASWCIPCREEGPQLVAFSFQHHQSGDASVVSVVFQDTTLGARDYQAQIGAEWPTLSDTNGSIALNYGVRGDPTSFLIAPSGRIVASIVSGVTAKALDALIRKAESNGYGF